MLSFKFITAVLFLGFMGVVGFSIAKEFAAGKPSIVDGRTMIVSDVIVELDGIQTPGRNEMCQRHGFEWPCGMLSAAALTSVLGSRSVWCLQKMRISDERIVATCYAGLMDVAEAQVKAGWAQYEARRAPKYVREQESARRRGVGMWRQQPLHGG